MKKVLCIFRILAVLSLTACQMNNIRDTGGGAAAPVSTVTGVKLENGSSNNP